MTASNPYTTMFDVQKQMIESSWKAVEGAATVQRNFAEATLESVDATKSAQEKGVDFSKRAVAAYFDALEQAGVPAEAVQELRATIDEQYDAFEDAHADAWAEFEANFEEGFDAYDELTESQLEVLEDAFDAMLDANEQAAEAAEDIDIDVEVVDPTEN